MSVGFEQSIADDCIFLRGTTISMMYVKDGTFMGPSKAGIMTYIMKVETILNLMDDVDISDYLGIKGTKLQHGHISLMEPHIIDIHFQGLIFCHQDKTKRYSSNLLNNTTERPGGWLV